ncbi:MAG: hypothetical protein ACXIUM_13325 [Wenzhouxiangella sp.]
MNNTHHRKLGLSAALAVILALAWASASWAGVVIEQSLRVEGSGMMRFINMTGTSVTTVEADRARTDSEIEMESRLMRMAARGGSGSEIVRLDQGMVYELDLRRRRYTETSLEEQAKAMAAAMEEMRNAQSVQKQGAMGIDEDQCEWSEPVSSVERSGERDDIAGFSAQRVSFTTTQSCVLRQSDQVCDYRMRIDQWMTVDPAAGQSFAVLEAYQQEYARQLGLDEATMRGFAEQGVSLLSGYEALWGEVQRFMSELDGFPLRSRMSLAVGGPQCEAVQQAQSAMPGVGEAIGGAVGGALGGVLGRQRDRGRAEREAEAAPSGELIEFMSIQTETMSIRQTAVEASAFAIPEGFRRAR